MSEEYAIECHQSSASLRGALRLESSQSYTRVFGPIEHALEQSSSFTLDLRALAFLNSSGIRALGMLVLGAKKQGKSLVLVGDESVPWQRKTFPSLKGLHPALEVRFG